MWSLNRWLFGFSLASVGWLGAGSVDAVSPDEVRLGAQLFQQDWNSGNPALGSDGLGPLFNGTSCVACHHQGGVGGGGDARFNALSLSIESIQFRDAVKQRPVPRAIGGANVDLTAETVKDFFPGMVQSSGRVISTVALPHHATTPNWASVRGGVLSQIPVALSPEGGPNTAEEVRVSLAQSIVFQNEHAVIRARLFGRNTTPLFGAGQIDQVTDETLLSQVAAQKSHPEISGRVSILPDGKYGRFGWRANSGRLVQFVDQACANELGLETRRMPQPVDPTLPNYNNPTHDISDEQIRAMTTFVSALPEPTIALPSDPARLAKIHRGQKAFESVGCAVCHVPQLGSARGIYSDLLLHDMGPNLYDYNLAEPHVTRVRITRSVQVVPDSQVTVAYYGNAPIISNVSTTTRSVVTDFINPRSRPSGKDYVTSRVLQQMGRRAIGSRASAEFQAEVGMERQIEASNLTQEWRTPPLWGVANSAPYMHDGRADTLLEAIAMHDGESAGTRDRFLKLPLSDRKALIAFLETMVAPTNAPQAMH